MTDDDIMGIKCSQRLSQLKKNGCCSLSYLTLANRSHSYYYHPKGYLAYRDFLRSAIVLGDPVTALSDIGSIVSDFKKKCMSEGYSACFFASTKNTAEACRKEGFKCYYIGSESKVQLDKHSVAGNRKRSIRSSINSVMKYDLAVEEYVPDNGRDKDLETQILKSSRDWCACQNTPELGFIIGPLDFELTTGKRYFYCMKDGKVLAFVLYYPVYGTGSYYMDHTRRRHDAPRGCIDHIVNESFKILKNEGVNEIYMGLAPFSFLDSKHNDNPRYMNALFSAVRSNDFLYPSRSQLFFKKKFATDWIPNYACFHPRITARSIFAIMDSFCPGGLMSLLSYKTRQII
jgi:phosphatidylglycerol lysyltransferase